MAVSVYNSIHFDTISLIYSKINATPDEQAHTLYSVMQIENLKRKIPCAPRNTYSYVSSVSGFLINRKYIEPRDFALAF